MIGTLILYTHAHTHTTDSVEYEKKSHMKNEREITDEGYNQPNQT